MNTHEAKLLADLALRCGAISAESTCGVVRLAFQAFDNLFHEMAFVSVSITSKGLSISEMRSDRTWNAIQWESKLATILGKLDHVRMNFSGRIAA